MPHLPRVLTLHSDLAADNWSGLRTSLLRGLSPAHLQSQDIRTGMRLLGPREPSGNLVVSLQTQSRSGRP